MVFIPNDNALRVGDKVKINRPCSTCAGTFTRGHEFIIDTIGQMGSTGVCNLVDEDGHRLNDVPPAFLEKGE